MLLIRKLSTRVSKKGNLESWGIFWCDYCKSEVEKRLTVGRISKSCGCKRNELIAESHIGKKHSEETREKQSKSMVGYKRTIESKIKQSRANKGRKLSKDWRKKISKSTKERFENPKNHPMYGRYGELSGNWQNGKSFEIYPIEFKQIKKFILERDNYICQYPRCMEIHDRLHIHHIDYDKQNNNPENLITLGTSCHTKTNGKNKRIYYTEFYQTIMMYRIVECLL